MPRVFFLFFSSRFFFYSVVFFSCVKNKYGLTHNIVRGNNMVIKKSKRY
jgi:hypothetical protein